MQNAKGLRCSQLCKFTFIVSSMGNFLEIGDPNFKSTVKKTLKAQVPLFIILPYNMQTPSSYIVISYSDTETP